METWLILRRRSLIYLQVLRLCLCGDRKSQHFFKMLLCKHVCGGFRVSCLCNEKLNDPLMCIYKN